MRNSLIRIATFFGCSFAILYFGVALMFPEPVDDADMAAVKDALSAQISAGKTEIPVSEIFPQRDFGGAQFCMKSFESETGIYGLSFFSQPSSQKNASQQAASVEAKSMATFTRSVRAGGRTYRFNFEDARKWDCAPYVSAVFRVVQDSQTERFSLLLTERTGPTKK
ncbi:MAG: hypothetical protein K0R10_2753 [Alphaproteobacteria bacterium]|nr:hypothetical protein [Alphaproteobacteria bacterium]